MSASSKTTTTTAKPKSGQKRKRDKYTDDVEPLTPSDVPKTLWSSPAGQPGGGLGNRCSDFQNKFKEAMFDELRAPVDISDEITHVAVRGVESTAVPDLLISTTVDAVLPPALAPVSSTRSTSNGGIAIGLNIHADTSVVRCESNPSPNAEISPHTDATAGPSAGSVFSYNGPTFGIDPSVPLTLSSAPAIGNSVKTDPLNPWFLSQGIPNFAKNSANSSLEESKRASKRQRQTPDILSQIGGSLPAVTSNNSSSSGNPRAVMTNMLDEEKEKAKRLESVLLSALLPK